MALGTSSAKVKPMAMGISSAKVKIFMVLWSKLLTPRREVGCNRMREVPEEEVLAMEVEAPDGGVPAVDEESPDSGFLALGEETPDNSDPAVEIENGVTQEMPTLPDGYYELEAIRQKRMKKGRAEYFVKWCGWPESENTWEPYEHLEGVSSVVEEFEQSLHSAKGRRGRKQKQWQKRCTPTFVVTNDASLTPDNGNSGQDNDVQEPDQTINVESIDVQMQGVGEADVNGHASEDLCERNQQQGKEVMGARPVQKRGYVSWSPEMDTLLTSTLFQQINEGNKGEGDFKIQAYQAVVDKLRTELCMQVTVEHVKNRIKVWKRHYAVITEIRNYTKFKWDEERKMVVIPIEDLKEWKTYCEDVPYASAYQNKCVDNWDDICALFASDRAIGDGAEQHEEPAIAMDIQNEANSTSSGESNKKQKRDRLADAVSSFAESFKEYLNRAKNPPRPTSKEIYDEVSSVVGLSRHQILKAVKKFVNGTIDEFDMLKNLPEEEKLDWILLCIGE